MSGRIRDSPGRCRAVGHGTRRRADGGQPSWYGGGASGGGNRGGGGYGGGFADDLDDPTGDLLCANLLLGAQRRGAGLASVLESVAQSVSEDVRGRRMVEADRAKPRATARWVTLITIAVLLFLFFATSYVDPYRSGIGQVILAVLLSAYVGCLVWMRAMARGKELPRFIGTDVAEEVR